MFFLIADANTAQEAWDSYVQSSGGALDSGFQFFQAEQTQPDREGQPTDKYTFGDSVFMGANTPGR
jgi:hypothetical protein